MIHDYYLRAPTEAAIDAALLAAGLLVEITEPDIETGDPVVVGAAPASPLVCIDRIGTISRVTGYVDDEPVVETLPDYHANVRLLFEPTQEQLDALAGVVIEAPGLPYRVWA